MYVYNNPKYNDIIKDFKASGSNRLTNVTLTFANPLDLSTLYYDISNPFEKLATALYILSGCNDVNFMMNYKDKVGKYEYEYNAPIGERIRCYNKNGYQNFVFNPIDQLYDAHEKLVNGKDAVIQIYNPMFDNSEFASSDSKGLEPKDLTLALNVNNGYLNATLLSSEANILDVFSSTLEGYTALMRLLSCWLNVKVGMFTHVILNLYCDNTEVIKVYNREQTEAVDIETSVDNFNEFIFIFFNKIVDTLHDDNFILSTQATELLSILKTIPDKYFRNVAITLFACRTFKLGEFSKLYKALAELEGTIKLECLHHVYNACKRDSDFKELYKDFSERDIRYIEHKIQRSF